MKTQTWLPWDTALQADSELSAVTLWHEAPSESLDASVLEQRTRAFPLGPDNSEPFLGEAYRNVLAAVVQDLKDGRRLLCLSGPPGVGKSFLLRQLRRHFSAAFIGEISQPALGGLPPRLADGLGLSITGEDEAAVRKCFQQFFDNARTRDQPVIQVIDDAETLKPADLAQLRRLFDPIHGQLLLVGQPEMLVLFADDEVVPNSIHCLSPLSHRETGEYVRHRLREGGFGAEVIDAEAIGAIYDYSGGIPRLINLLCFSVLADADFASSRLIDVERIHEAAQRRMQSGSYPFLRSPLQQKDSAVQDVASVADESPTEGVREQDDGLPSFVATGWEWNVTPESTSIARDAALRHAEAASKAGSSGTSEVKDVSRAAVRTTHGSWPRWLRHGLAVSLVLAGGAAGYMLDRTPFMNLTRLTSGATTHSVSRVDTAFHDNPSAPIVRTPAREEVDDPIPPTPTANAAPPPTNAPASPSALAERSDHVDTPAQTATPPAEAPRGHEVTGHSASSLSVPQRRYLARLYAERAEYEQESGRWDDAEVSVRRGLELVPDDVRLHELKVALNARDSSSEPRPMPTVTPVRVAAGRPLSDATTQPDVARIYLQRAQYEWQNRRLRDALVSIGYGLEGDPNNSALLDMRARVLSELDRRP